MKITNKIQETFQSLFRKEGSRHSPDLTKHNYSDTLDQTSEIWLSLRKGLIMGFGFMLGMFGTGLTAVAVTGTIKVWSSNEKLTASDLNTTIASLRTAIEGITSSQWTTSGSNISYSAGNVGIGTSSPTLRLDILTSTINTGIKIANSSSGEIQLIPKLGYLAYNGITQADDIGIIFKGSSIRTGNFVIAPKSSGTLGIRITSSGNVGIGTTSPTASLTVNNSSNINLGLPAVSIGGNRASLLMTGSENGIAWNLQGAGNSWTLAQRTDVGGNNNDLKLLRYNNSSYIDIPFQIQSTTGNIGISTSSPSTKLHVAGNACTTGTGMTACASDKRLKENIQPITNALDTILKIKPVTFVWNQIAEKEFKYKSGQKDLGVIAQDIETINPEWVETAPNGYKRVNDTFAKWYVIGAIQELKGLLDSKEKSKILVDEKQEKELKDLSLRLRSVTEENAELKKQLSKLRKENSEFKMSVLEELKQIKDLRYAKK